MFCFMKCDYIIDANDIYIHLFKKCIIVNSEFECFMIMCKHRILRWLNDEEENLKAEHQPKIQYLIIEMSRKHFRT